MLDCGMHMGFNDARRFPDFDKILQYDRYGDKIDPVPPKTHTPDTFTPRVDAVIISHYHLDHCGALPFFSERKGYKGPIYMSAPTKTICPRLIDDFRRISIIEDTKPDKHGTQHPVDPCYFTSDDIDRCFSRVQTLPLGAEVQVCEGVRVTTYYAGHVVGAVMILVESGGESALYTGDYNMTPDQHLGSAYIPRVVPDVIITEGTYAATVRDARLFREQAFLAQVQATIDRGGRVLIPVFALGRAQELCLLLDAHWRRHGLHGRVPIYVSAGLALVASEYYRTHAQWCHEGVRQRLGHGALEGGTGAGSGVDDGNAFELPGVQALPKDAVETEGPAVVLSTPGMLHAGTSLAVFRRWCSDARNLVVIPGYCVPGTVGAQVLAGQRQVTIRERDKKDELVDVCMQVSLLSFSAHADAHGIGTLVRQSGARHVVLVHGEALKLDALARRLRQETGVACSAPATHEGVAVAGGHAVGTGWTNVPRGNRKRARTLDAVRTCAYVTGQRLASEAARSDAAWLDAAAASLTQGAAPTHLLAGADDAGAGSVLAHAEEAAIDARAADAEVIITHGGAGSVGEGVQGSGLAVVTVDSWERLLGAAAVQATVSAEVKVTVSGERLLAVEAVEDADAVRACARDGREGRTRATLLGRVAALLSGRVDADVRAWGSGAKRGKAVSYEEEMEVRVGGRLSAGNHACGTGISGVCDGSEPRGRVLVRAVTVGLGAAVAATEAREVRVRLEWDASDEAVGAQVEEVVREEVAAIAALGLC